MLSINGLNKNFRKKVVLENFSFNFENGVYGLLGPNGAGKTTLIRCITMLYPIEENAILYNGVSINKSKDYLEHVGYLPQKFGLFKDLNVNEMLQLMANLKGVEKTDSKRMIADSLKLVNLSDKAESKISTLSGGMIRRLGIAQAILNDPEIIIFDEPTAGLDPEERLRFKNIISEIKEEKTIIISTHIVEDVEAICDKVAIMKTKNIAVSGSCQDIENIARDKVYELPETEINKINGEYHIQKHFEQNGIKMIKILTNLPQKIESSIPNVEDGYICTLKNI